MSNHYHLAIGLLLTLNFVTQNDFARGQESASPGAADSTTTERAAPEASGRSSKPATDISIGEVLPDRAPLWLKFNSSPFYDEVPVETESFDSEEAARRHLNEAVQAAMSDYLTMLAKSSRAKHLVKLTSADLQPPSIESLKEQVFHENGDPKLVRLAVLYKVPDATRQNWLGRWKYKKQQIAIEQTLFVFSGVLAVIGILAIQAKTNHATNGRRVGILRAAAAIAILTLIGGLTTAAVMGRIFTA